MVHDVGNPQKTVIEELEVELGTEPASSREATLRGRITSRIKRNPTAYLMIAPMVIGLTIFVIWPLIYAFYLSLHEISWHRDNVFVGLRFYRLLLQNPLFWRAMRVGFTYAAIVVPTGMVISFLLASFIKRLSGKMAAFMKVTVYVPAVVSSVVAALLFMFMYQSRGVANATLALFNVGPIAWLTDPSWVLPSIAVPGVWLGLGFTTLVMLSALLDVPESYYEAAKLDGANWIQRTFYITIPSMKNILLYLFVTGFVGAVQMLDLPMIMTGGGPVGTSTTPNLFVFNLFRDGTTFARSSSITASLLLFLMLGAVSALIFRLVKSEKSVDS